MKELQMSLHLRNCELQTLIKLIKVIKFEQGSFWYKMLKETLLKRFSLRHKKLIYVVRRLHSHSVFFNVLLSLSYLSSHPNVQKLKSTLIALSY